jgi:hypothetical protein
MYSRDETVGESFEYSGSDDGEAYHRVQPMLAQCGKYPQPTCTT